MTRWRAISIVDPFVEVSTMSHDTCPLCHESEAIGSTRRPLSRCEVPVGGRHIGSGSSATLAQGARCAPPLLQQALVVTIQP